MNLNRFKKTITVSTLGLAVLLGASGIANAQVNKKEQREQQKVVEQQRKADDRRAKFEDQKIKTDQRREQMRIRKMPVRPATSGNNRYRVNRNGSVYETNNRGAELLKQAVNAGYQEGYRGGRNDRTNRRASNFKTSSVYRKGNYGYQNYVNSEQYQYYFQQGFERGYDDGFNSRYENGTNTNGSLNILENILQNILTIESY
jgi:hypothetical protein